MSKKTKNFLMVCGALIVTGLVFMGVGYVLGENESLSFNVGDKSVKGKVVQNEKTLEMFTNVDIKSEASEVEFVAGDEYKIKYAYNDRIGEPNIKIEKGTLYVEDLSTDTKSKNLKNRGELYIKIYYPRNEKFDNINVICNLGDLDMVNVYCNSLNAKLDCGDVELKRVEMQNGNIALNLGDFDAEELKSGRLVVATQAGDIKMAGKFYGESNITSDMGDIDVKTQVPRTAYNYDINSSLGDVTIDEMDSSDEKSGDSDSLNYLTIKNKAGDISVEFEEEMV